MKYAEAFEKLGYKLDNNRQDWTAAKEDGVCITLWTKQLGRNDKLPYFDIWELHPEGGEFVNQSGHKKRTAHLERAVGEFGGKVDVVLVYGEPGVSYGDAEPWDIARRGGEWKVTEFDRETGFFRAEIARLDAADAS